MMPARYPWVVRGLVAVFLLGVLAALAGLRWPG